jgi:lipopolysaccharide export system permease protein
MRAAGISIYQLVLAVLKAGMFMLVFVFLIGEFVGPVSEEYVRKMKVEKQQQKITLKSKYGFWARDGQEFINIRKILPGSQLEDIYIYQIGVDKKLQLATYAKSARYVDDKWELQGILQSSIQQDQVISRSVGSASWSSMIDPNLLSIIVVEPTMLPAWGLFNYMNFMNQNGQDATTYEVAFWRKIITPFTTVVMLIIAVPFVLGSLREVGVGQRVFIGTLIGTVFYALNQSFSYLSVVYRIEPFIATTMPGIIVFLIGFYFIRKLN